MGVMRQIMRNGVDVEEKKILLKDNGRLGQKMDEEKKWVR